MRRGIILLITLFFIIAITVLFGISLQQNSRLLTVLEREQFLLQRSAIIEDTLRILQKNPNIDLIKDAMSMDLFLSTASFIPVEVQGLEILLSLSAHDGRANINALSDSVALQNSLKEYLLRFEVQDVDYFVDLLLDASSKKKEQFLTDYYEAYPYRYHEQMYSETELQQLIDFYEYSRHDNHIEKVPFKALFRYDDANNTLIDANYMKAPLWQMLLPDITPERAKTLEERLSVYEKESDLQVNDAQLSRLKSFNVAFFSPRLFVELEMNENNSSSLMHFMYDLQRKKAGEFTFDF